MVVVIRHNSALNNAAAGLAAGLPQGIQLGQNARRIADHEQQQAFEQQQALRAAQLVDQQLQQEQSQNAAVGEAAGFMAEGEGSTAPAPKHAGAAIGGAMGGGMGAGIAAAGASGSQDQQAIQRIKSIAQRLPPKYAMTFVEAAKEKHKALVDKRERKGMTDRVSRGVSAGSYFTQMPDGQRIETPGMHDALKKWSELLANPETPIDALNAQMAIIDSEQIHSKFEFKHIGAAVADMDQRMAQAVQPQTPGPQTGVAMAASDAKKKAMGLAISAYEHLAPQYMRDPEKWGPMEQKIFQQFAQAEQGIAFIDKDLGPVTFEAAEQVRKSKAMTEQWKQKASEMQAAFHEARAKAVPVEAEAKNTKAQADLLKAKNAGNAKPLTYDQALDNARAMLKDQNEKDPSVKLSPELTHFTAAKLMAADERLRAEQSNAQAAGNTDAPTDQPKLDTRAAREADIRAHPEKYKHLTTAEQINSFLDTGK